VKRRALSKLDSGPCIYICGNFLSTEYKIGKSREINKTLATYRRKDPSTVLFALVYIPDSDLDIVDSTLLRALGGYKVFLNHEVVDGISPRNIVKKLIAILGIIDVEGRSASLQTLNEFNSDVLNDDLNEYDLSKFLVSEIVPKD